MREIKFRAWNDISKEMLYHGKDIQGLIWWNEFGEIQSLAKAELMQSTGLKDKNGKEIYEGDIIEMQHCDECNGLKAVVKRYWDGWWYFTEVETKGRMGEMVSQYVANFDEKFGELSYCIVIGNKYEDGDLIECS